MTLTVTLSHSDEAVTLNMGNKMFLEKTFDVLKEYKDLLKEAYRSTIQPANFLSDAEAVRLEINKWVEEVTQSKIRDLIAEGVLSCETALVLVNAIYFKGLWDFQFNPEATSKREFHETKDKSTMVDMMYKQAKFRTGYCDQLKVTVLEIPYKGSKTSMVVLLPNNIGDLSALEEAMTASKISNLLASMGEPSLVDLNLPRFKLEQTTNLKKQLEAMGINDLFSDRADLSGISSKAQLKVSDAIHKAFVEVNEEGTEAAAATCVTMVARCAVMGMPFNVNHPFLFLIRSRDPNVILFMGSVRQI